MCAMGVAAVESEAKNKMPSTTIWGRRSPFSYFSSAKICSAMGRHTIKAGMGLMNEPMARGARNSSAKNSHGFFWENGRVTNQTAQRFKNPVCPRV